MLQKTVIFVFKAVPCTCTFYAEDRFCTYNTTYFWMAFIEERSFEFVIFFMMQVHRDIIVNILV